MAARLRWMSAVAAIIVGCCLVPGSLVVGPTPVDHGPSALTSPASVGSGGGIECAAVSCNRGSTSAGTALPGFVAVAAAALLVVVVPALRRVRRALPAARALPAGVLSRLFRPPQPFFPA